MSDIVFSNANGSQTTTVAALNSKPDTKNTAGTTNKTGTKLFLAGATSQDTYSQTYSNSNVYIGTDNCLYSGGNKVAVASDIPSVPIINSISESEIELAFSRTFGTLSFVIPEFVFTPEYTINYIVKETWEAFIASNRNTMGLSST